MAENSWEPEWHLKHAQELLQEYKNRHIVDKKSRNQLTQPTPTRSTWTPPTTTTNNSSMPKYSSKNPTSPRLTNPGYMGQPMPTSSMPTQEDAPALPPYSSLEPSSFQRRPDSRSRHQGETFGVKKREEWKSSELTPDDSKRSKKDPGKTRTALTNSKTFSATLNHPSPYGLRSKIRLPARYLLTLQTEQGNFRQNLTWSSDNSRKPRQIHKRPYCKEQMQSKHSSAYKKTPSASLNQPTDMGWRTNASSSQLRPSGENTGQMSKEYQKTKKLYRTEDDSLLDSPDPLSILVSTDHLCPGLGDTLVCFLCAAPERAPPILCLAGKIVAEALIMNDQSEGPNETLCNLGPIAHLIPLPGWLRAGQKPILLSSLTTVK
jgi:hypothetical protein